MSANGNTVVLKLALVLLQVKKHEISALRHFFLMPEEAWVEVRPIDDQHLFVGSNFELFEHVVGEILAGLSIHLLADELEVILGESRRILPL